MTQHETARPVEKFKAGAVHAALWQHETKDGVRRYVTLDRVYADKEGKWKATASLHVNDIPKAILALQQAYAALVAPQDVEASSDPAVAARRQ